MRNAFTVIFAASGAAALIYEVTWTRLLTLQVGHGVAATSTVLAAFMGGLAVGSALSGRLSAGLSPARALRVYAALELAIGVLALLLPLELSALSPLLSRAYADGSGGVTFTALRLGDKSGPAVPAGSGDGRDLPGGIPLVRSQRTGRGARRRRMYAANTIGAAVGALRQVLSCSRHSG